MSKSPLKAIREKCIDCCCGQLAEVKQCPSVRCALHPFRMGKNPYRARREMTVEQRQAAIDRLSKIRPKNQG